MQVNETKCGYNQALINLTFSILCSIARFPWIVVMLHKIDIQTHVFYPYQAPYPHDPLPRGLVRHLDWAAPEVGGDIKPEGGKHGACNGSSKHLFRRMIGEVDAREGDCCCTWQGENNDWNSFEGRKMVTTKKKKKKKRHIWAQCGGKLGSWEHYPETHRRKTQRIMYTEKNATNWACEDGMP